MADLSLVQAQGWFLEFVEFELPFRVVFFEVDHSGLYSMPHVFDDKEKKVRAADRVGTITLIWHKDDEL